MDKRKKTRVILIFPCLVLICFCLWFLRSYYLRTEMDFQVVYSENGVWDLSDFDFNEGFVLIRGNGETIQNALVAPGDFDTYPEQPIYSEYTEQPVNTTRLRLLLPDEGRYMVAGGSVFYGERTFVNGERRMDAGSVGETAETSTPGYAYLAAEACAEGGVIEIVRQTNNFVHRTNGDPVSLYVGSPETIQRFMSLDTGQSGMVMGIFFTLFLAHGMLYLILKRYHANIYFAFLCLGWCLRCGVTDRTLIASWFPGIPWELLLRTEYLMVAVAGSCICLVINEMFPSALPKRLMRLVLGYSAFYALLCLVMPTYPLSYMNVICPVAYNLFTPFLVFYLLKYLFARIRKGEIKLEQWVMLISLGFFMIAALHDVFYYTSHKSMALFSAMNGLGFMTFALSQMFAIFCGTMREVELVQQAEQELRLEADTLLRVNTLKEEFLHDLSHELQMPITVMSGFAQLTVQMMEDDALDRNAVRDNMLRVVDEAEHMERMVSSLLDAAAIENGSFRLVRERLDLGEFIKNTVTTYFPLLDRRGNRAVFRISEGLFVDADRERLQQVLLNLISNAIKHTNNGTITFSAVAEEGFARVAVSDSGEGIPPELLPELFNRFSKHRETGGNGLGLYICMRLVEAHGGNIDIESGLGQGTSVWFTIPLSKEEN